MNDIFILEGIKLLKEYEIYHKLDCDCLLEALQALNAINRETFKYDITETRTSATLAKKVFLNIYY